MAIQASAIPIPIVAPQIKIALVDERGILTKTGQQFAQQIWAFNAGMSRLIPCNCTNVGNVYTWTQLGVGPHIAQYASFDQFGFVASATSGGSVTANVTTNEGALATLKVYITNGSSQAGANDIVVNLHYWATFVDSLDGGAGGFVIR